MKKLIVLMLFLFTVLGVSVGAEAGDAILSWSAPTTNADGSGPVVVTGYKVYTRTGATYAMGVDVGNVLTKTFTGLSVGTHYFVVTAYNISGEGSFSYEVSKTIIQPVPGAPTCTIQ